MLPIEALLICPDIAKDHHFKSLSGQQKFGTENAQYLQCIFVCTEQEPLIGKVLPVNGIK